MGCTIQIGQKAVAQTDVAYDVVELSIGIACTAELPWLTWSACSVETEHGCEARELCPAGAETSPARVVHISTEETARVTVPIGQSRFTKVTCGRNLVEQGCPVAVNVGTPDISTRTLHAQIARTSHNADALTVEFRQGTMVVTDALNRSQREGVAQAAPRLSRQCYIVLIAFVAEEVWLGGIHPIGIKSPTGNAVVEILPIDVTCLSVIRVIGFHTSSCRPCFRCKE